MRTSTFLLTALPFLAAPLGVAAQEEAGGQCIIIHGLGSVVPMACGSSGASPGDLSPEADLLISLSGSLELRSQGLSDKARVTCWVCEEGSCSDASPYGPATREYSVSPSPSALTQVDWQTFFLLNSQAVATNTPVPTLRSYYCRVELENLFRTEPSITPMPYTMPSYFSTFSQARAEEGSTLVTELQGSFSEPVDPKTARRTGGVPKAGGGGGE